MTRRTRRNPLTSVGDLPPLSPFNGVLTHLSHSRAAVLQTLGDSTVYGYNATTNWGALMCDQLGAYYDANVWTRTWNTTNQAYDPPVVRRTSTQGERVLTISASSLMQFAAANVATDLEIILKLTPAAWGVSRTLISKTGGAGNRGWTFSTNATKNLLFSWSVDGTALLSVTSTAAVGFTDGAPGWVRVTFQLNNGSSGNTVTFYTSANGSSWTILGTAKVTAGVTSMFPTTSTVQFAGGSTTAAIGWSYIQVRDGLANGADMVPNLPDQWDAGTATPTYSGGPTVMLMNGGANSTDLTYLDDPTRFPKLVAYPSPDVVFIGYGINDAELVWRQFAEHYLRNVRRIKNWRPGVPIVATTENPVVVGTGKNAIQVQSLTNRHAAMATMMAAEPGVTVLDTYQAYTDLSTQLQADNLHPTDTGHQVQADWMMRRLTPKTMP